MFLTYRSDKYKDKTKKRVRAIEYVIAHLPLSKAKRQIRNDKRRE